MVELLRLNKLELASNDKHKLIGTKQKEEVKHHCLDGEDLVFHQFTLALVVVLDRGSH